MKHGCPICNKQIDQKDYPAKTKYYPFCSNRCRLIDLGAWLNADYRVISDDQEDINDEHQEVQ